MKLLRILAVLILTVSAGWVIAEEPVTFRPGTTQNISVSTSQGTSSVLATALSPHETPIIFRAVCTVACFIAVSDVNTTTSTTNAVYLPAGVPEYFRANAGNTVVHISSSSGTLYITEMHR